MTTKATILALTLGALTTLSIAAQAEEAAKPYYGSIRLGLIKETGSSVDFKNWSSRFGLQGETQARAGLDVFGKYELGVNVGEADKEDLTTRHAYVGLKSKAGKITLGKTYHSFYNIGVGPIDLANEGSCNGCLSYTGRTTGLSYEKSFGNLTVGATRQFRNDEDNKQTGNELGVSYKLGKHTIGLAAQDLQDQTDKTVAANIGGTIGPIAYGAYIAKQGSLKGADVHLGYKNAYFTIGQKDTDADTRSRGVTLGYNQPIGKNLSSWFEASRTNTNAADSVDVNTLRAAIQYDF